jgi:diphthamide biosynthesis methyltransferase
LSKDQKSKLTAVFTDFYTAQQKAMEDMRASGSFDRDAMQAKRKELEAESNTRVKEIMNADQYKKWIDEIQPSMRPQRKAN